MEYFIIIYTDNTARFSPVSELEGHSVSDTIGNLQEFEVVFFTS